MKKLRFICAAWLLLAFNLWAHDPGLSGTLGKLQGDRLILNVSFAIRDAAQLTPLDANHDGEVTADEFAQGRELLAQTTAAHCAVSFDGVSTKADTAIGRQDDAKNVSVQLNFKVPPAKQMALDFNVIQLMPFGHRMFVSITDATGKTLIEQLLSANATLVTITLNSPAVAAPVEKGHTFQEFVFMGIEHILTGYDHLLFLCSLLMVTRTFRSALGVITAFTIAHSITLAVSTFNLVTISPNITEPLIAATIVYVALENLFRHGAPKNRWRLTFAFGLIHGFGFATALREMGVGQRAGGVLMPLFGFNVGVELGQLTVAAIVLPLIWKLRTKDQFLRWGIPAGSTAVALAGGFWFVQRVWFS